MPAYCVGQICVQLEKLPTQEELDKAALEEQRRQISAATTQRLTRLTKAGELAKRPAFRPGQTTP